MWWLEQWSVSFHRSPPCSVKCIYSVRPQSLPLLHSKKASRCSFNSVPSHMGIRCIGHVFASVEEDCNLHFFMCFSWHYLQERSTFIQTMPFISRGVNYLMFYCKYVYLRIYVLYYAFFFLMSYNRSYENNEDFFQANQAKDSPASIRRFCIWFWFFGFVFVLLFTFLPPWHVFFFTSGSCQSKRSRSTLEVTLRRL